MDKVALIRSSGSTLYEIKPLSRAVSASIISPEMHHSKLLEIPTSLGRNQLEQASGAMPLFVKGNEYLLLEDATLISAAN